MGLPEGGGAEIERDQGLAKPDGSLGKSNALAGGIWGPDNVVLPWSLWLGCWREQPECGNRGGNQYGMHGGE